MNRHLALLALLLASSPAMAQETAKAVVQFDGTPWNGTYSQGSNTISITQNSDPIFTDLSSPKDIEIGELVYLDFTSGGAADGSYEVATKSGNNFTVSTASGNSLSGNVTIRVHSFREQSIRGGWRSAVLEDGAFDLV
jgi:opacity protein-like surface antigen